MRKIILCLIGFLLISTDAFSLNLRTNTRKVELKVDEGQTYRGTITIENPTEGEIKVRVYVEDFSYIAPYDGAKKFLAPGSDRRSSAKWITFFPQEFVLSAFEKKKVNYAVNVPSEISGGYYAVLFFESAMGEIPDPNTEGANILILGRLGTLFLIETQDSIKKAGIARIKVQDRTVKGEFLNQGNVVLASKGNFYVMDDKGNVFDRGKIKDIYISPGDSAPFSLSLAGEVPAGKYILVTTFDLSGGDILVKEIDFSIEEQGNMQVLRVRD